jgi:hypothetical protein
MLQSDQWEDLHFTLHEALTATLTTPTRHAPNAVCSLLPMG